MDTSKVIEAIGAAAAAVKPAQEYCFLWIDWWPMCMTKGEWSGWMQAIGSITAILASVVIVKYQLNAERKKNRRAAIAHINTFGGALRAIPTKLLKLPLEMGVLSFVQNVDKELRNGGKASTCGIHAGI